MEKMKEEIVMIDVQDVSMRFMMSNDKIGSLKEMVTQLIQRKIKSGSQLQHWNNISVSNHPSFGRPHNPGNNF